MAMSLIVCGLWCLRCGDEFDCEWVGTGRLNPAGRGISQIGGGKQW